MGLINDLVKTGLTVEIGPHHSDYSGYYASVYNADDAPECAECEHCGHMDWEHAGHGKTPEEALISGIDIYHGAKCTISSSEYVK